MYQVNIGIFIASSQLLTCQERLLVQSFNKVKNCIQVVLINVRMATLLQDYPVMACMAHQIDNNKLVAACWNKVITTFSWVLYKSAVNMYILITNCKIFKCVHMGSIAGYIYFRICLFPPVSYCSYMYPWEINVSYYILTLLQNRKV